VKKYFLVLAIMILGLGSTVQAQTGKPIFSYDVSGGTGSYNGNTYTEVHLGLNWPVYDWLNWRNALFTRFGSTIDTIYGLDSSLLLQKDFYTQGRGAGIEFSLGPGVRMANENNNAVFGQAGITFALAGIRLGVGAQALHYFATRIDKENTKLPEDEVHYFITLSGGGVF
jgi:hypothetical protein